MAGKGLNKAVLFLAAAGIIIAATWAFLGASKPGPGGKTQIQGGIIMVKLETNKGDILLSLDSEKAPETTANFIQYVKDGHYDGTIFHRVIDGFMIQGGGFDREMNQKDTRPAIKNEADNGLKNSAYTIAMARTSDPHSATAQFFINVKDNPALDYRSSTPQGWGYAVFGKVIDGMEAVDKIRQTPTGAGGPGGRFSDVPINPVIIHSVTILPIPAPPSPAATEQPKQ